MQKIFNVVIAILLGFPGLAQNKNVKGVVSDTLAGKVVESAVILFITEDSTINTFTRTNHRGEFNISVPAHKYTILINYPKFANYAALVDLTQNDTLDLGTIGITRESALLEEIIIRGRQAVRVRGDTTEFVADSFLVQEGATAEELLAKLPGFQVDNSGKIKVQGKIVQKVLVDGEEFFGDDPTIATQNLSAKSIDKVQVYNSLSTQQQITGLASNNESKIVNIKLKDSYKKGGFGKVNIGSDLKKYLDSKFILNHFINKRKTSVFATKSNVSTGSLNFDDQNKVGFEPDPEYDEVSGSSNYTFNFNEFDYLSQGGLPDSYSAGALFLNKWNMDKQNANTSYRFNSLRNSNVISTLTQNILPDGITYSDRAEQIEGLSQQHLISAKYEWRPDSLASFKFVTSDSHKNAEKNSQASSNYRDKNDMIINTSNQTNDFNSNKQQTDNQLTYKQLFHKKNRLLLASLRFGLQDNHTEGLLNSTIKFLNSNVNNRDSTINQYKENLANTTAFGAKVTYSEPLSTKWNLILVYSLNTNYSTSNLATFNQSSNGKYEVIDSGYSNNFMANTIAHSSSLLFRYDEKKIKFTLGSGVSNINLKLLNAWTSEKVMYDFLNITPVLAIRIYPKPQKSININYNGSTLQPGIDQLQPIKNNNDPLNIFVGNPNLRVGFRHAINASYNFSKLVKQIYSNISAGYSLTNNAIANASTIDSAGRRTYSPVNVNGNKSWNLYWNYNKGQGNKKLQHSFQVYSTGGNSVIITNGIKGINFYLTTDCSYGISYNDFGKFSFSVRPKLGYNISMSRLLNNLNTRYFTYGANIDISKNFPFGIELRTNLSLDTRQKISAFDKDFKLVLWNASVAKSVFKNKTGRISFLGNDMLNQNKGYSRFINSNFISEQQFLRVSRYFMLRFEWSFNNN